ncbi:MAG: TIGR04013 family B12-binding domain/radical SAM domain-containing protein [Candidatus Goldbacteria bacterium]|nr:TIGR04013 family B12-binding domain/radical SAM domain-containing protein [Candidatus Goldiibacteriota bacterium]
MIILCLSKNNRNSIYALLGILEVYGYYLEKDVFIYDFNSKNTKLKITKNQKHYFLFSFVTKDAEENYNELKKLKSIYKKSVFICGGPHPTGAPKDCLNKGFDIVIQGEAENIINNILNSANLKICKSSKFVDLNSFPPFPLKDPHYSLYIEISRGCPHNCYFCQVTKIFGSKPRHRSIENIVKYCEILIKNNLTDLRFVSSNAFSYGSANGIHINYIALENLLKSLHKITKGKGRIFFGSFPSEVRPEFVNEDTISLIKKYCSNKNIMIGGQSGSEKVLKKINRNHTVEDIINASKISLKYGLLPNIDIISGFPFETENDVNKTIKLCENLIDMGCKIHIHKFNPLPGTQFEQLSQIEFLPQLKNFLNKCIGKGRVYGKIN